MVLCGVRSCNCKNPSAEFFKSFHSAFVNIQEQKVCKIVSSSLLQKEHNGEETVRKRNNFWFK